MPQETTSVIAGASRGTKMSLHQFTSKAKDSHFCRYLRRTYLRRTFVCILLDI